MNDYQLESNEMALMHGSEPLRLFRDLPDEQNREIDALVASGDCFITLATRLDDLDQLLAPADAQVKAELERVVRTLLYLQRHYQVTKKRPNYRQ